MRIFPAQRHEGLVDRLCLLVGGFDIVTVIEDFADGHLRGELRDSARVVAMVVGDYQVIDLLHTRTGRRSGDAIRIAIIIAA